MKQHLAFTKAMSIVFATLFFIAIVWTVATMYMPSREYVSTREAACIDAGGIYLPGGFTASNCVFRPEVGSL